MAYTELQKVAMAAAGADTDFKGLATYMRYANDAVRELVLMTIPVLENLQIRSVVADMDRSTMNVYMPPDFVYPTKVGICYNGRTLIIDYDETLCFPSDAANINCSCSSEEDAVNTVNDVLVNGSTWGEGFTFYNTWRQGGYLGEIYGTGANLNVYGFYKYFKKENMMVFRNIPRDAEVIVEYKSDGVGSGVTLIPSEAEMAVRYYIKKLVAEDRGDRGMARDMDLQYQRQVKMLEMIYSADNVYKYRDAMLRSSGSTVKR